MRRWRGTATWIAAVGVLLTVAATSVVWAGARGQREDRFAAAASETRLALQERLLRTTNVALALRNGLMTGEVVDADEFERTATLAQQDDLLRAAQALSLVRAVPRTEVAAYEATQRRQGRPAFTVVPADDQAPVRFVVERISPLAGNEAAVGFDIGSNEDRRRAAEDARDRGEPAATRPLVLLQEEEGRRAVLLLLPLYATPEVPMTGPARRRHHTGFVSVVLRLPDLLDEVLGREPTLSLLLHDVGETAAAPDDTLTEDARLYGDPDLAPGADGLHAALDLNVGGRRWRLTAHPGPGFDRGLGPAPTLTAVLGLLATGLLTILAAGAAGARWRAEQLVEERTADLRRMIDFAPDATLVVDDTGVIRSASRRVRAILGHEPEALVGRSVEELLPDEGRAVHVAHRRRFIEDNRRAGAMAQTRNVQALHADGRLVDVEVTLNPLPTTLRRPGRVQVIASVRDVTQVREAARRTAQLNEQKSVFMRTVSHELRTPLTAIDGFVDILLRFGDSFSDAEKADFLDRIRRNTAQLQQLILEIIDFAQLDRTRHVEVGQPVELGRLVEQVVHQLSPVLHEHEVELLVEPDVVAALDHDATVRVVANLLTNAARYSPEGATVRVTVARVDGCPTVHVDDAGPGVPEEEREQVFVRFWRGSGPHVLRSPGTGIGLAVVAELMSAQGGRVAVGPSPLGGARFTASWPPVTGSARRLVDTDDEMDAG